MGDAELCGLAATARRGRDLLRLTANAILGRHVDGLRGERLGRLERLERVISDAGGDVVLLPVMIGRRRRGTRGRGGIGAMWALTPPTTTAALPTRRTSVPLDHHARSQLMVHLNEAQTRQLGVDLGSSSRLAHTFPIEDSDRLRRHPREPAHEGAWSSRSEGACPAPRAR
jgi:hypothetical protein